jgi:hypothetical protein
MTFSITALSIMTFSITAHSIMKFSITALSIMIFSITLINRDPQHNDTQHNGTVYIVLLCWVLFMMNVIYAECHKLALYSECRHAEMSWRRFGSTTLNTTALSFMTLDAYGEYHNWESLCFVSWCWCVLFCLHFCFILTNDLAYFHAYLYHLVI